MVNDALLVDGLQSVFPSHKEKNAEKREREREREREMRGTQRGRQKEKIQNSK